MIIPMNSVDLLSNNELSAPLVNQMLNSTIDKNEA